MESLKNRIFLLLLFALMSLSLLAPLGDNLVPPNSVDFVNHIAAIVQARLGLEQGQFPLRTMPNEFSGIYYPEYQFYSPTSYLVSGLIYRFLTPSNPWVAYKIMTFLALFMGGVYLYRTAKLMTKSQPAALLASVVFYTVPYFNILVGHMAGFNELIALCIVQCLFFYMLKLYLRENKIKYILLVSLLTYLLATTHLITFIYALLLMAIFFICFMLNNKRLLDGLKTGLAVVCGFVLAAWYLEPVALFAKYFNISGSFDVGSEIYSLSPTLASLLSPTLINRIFMPQNIFDIAYQTMGVPIWIGFIALIYLINVKSIRFRSKQGQYLIGLLSIFLLAVFITWSPFNIWQWLPHFLTIIQDTMRGLGYVSWIGSLLCAFSIILLFGQKLDARYVVVGALLIYAATNSLMPALSQAVLNVESIIKNPTLMFVGDAYLLDANRNPSLVSQLAEYNLTGLLQKNQLVLNTEYKLPRAILGDAKNPMLSIKGMVSGQSAVGAPHLQLIIHGSGFKDLVLKPGVLNWQIPLNSFKNADILPIKFKLVGRHDAAMKVDITQVAVTNLLLDDVLPVNKTKTGCKKNAALDCRITVPSTIHSLVLPFLYYPTLLKVTNNGREIPYYGVMKGNLLLVGIAAEAGMVNQIRVEFIGLSWANRLSAVGFSIWFLGLIYYGYGKLRHQRHRSRNV